MEQINTMDPSLYPMLILPRLCSNMETNCAIWENVFMDLNISSPNSDGHLELVYSGYCNVKIVDKYVFNLGSAINSEEEVIAETIQNDNMSGVWIDPVRSPYVYNNCDDDEYYPEKQTNNVTVQQHNTYITQNVYKCNDTHMDDREYRRIRKQNENIGESENSLNYDLYEEDEFEDEVLLSQISEEILNEKRAREERLFNENNALKQLISTNKRSITQQRTVLLMGDDCNNIHTVHNISVNDPNSECHGKAVSEIVIDDSERSSGRPKIYQCDKCKQIFDHISGFRRHIRGSHKRTDYGINDDYKPFVNDGISIFYKCEECGKCLKTQEKFERHLRGHGDPELECAKCKNVYASKASLKVHQKLHNRSYHCDWCSRSFTTKTELKSHITRAHQKKSKASDIDISDISLAQSYPYKENDGSIKNDHNSKEDAVLARVISNRAFLHTSERGRRMSNKSCEICNKNFDRISDLKRHLIEHIVKRTLSKEPIGRKGNLHLECIVCKQVVFSRVDQYKAHLREHAKLTLYKCTFCNKCFSDSSNFSKHKKIHAGGRYHCDMCQRKFQTKKMITKHMEYHSNNPPKTCNYCGRLFHFNSTLLKHIKSFHKAMALQTYQCLFCNDCFRSSRDKLEHEWRVHKSRKYIVDCLQCGRKFRKYSELKKHCKNIHGMKIPRATVLWRQSNL